MYNYWVHDRHISSWGRFVMIADMHDHVTALNGQMERDYGSEEAIQEEIL